MPYDNLIRADRRIRHPRRQRGRVMSEGSEIDLRGQIADIVSPGPYYAAQGRPWSRAVLRSWRSASATCVFLELLRTLACHRASLADLIRCRYHRLAV